MFRKHLCLNAIMKRKIHSFCTVNKLGKVLQELWNLAGDVQNWQVNFKALFKFQKCWSRVGYMWVDCNCVYANIHLPKLVYIIVRDKARPFFMQNPSFSQYYRHACTDAMMILFWYLLLVFARSPLVRASSVCSIVSIFTWSDSEIPGDKKSGMDLGAMSNNLLV